MKLDGVDGYWEWRPYLLDCPVAFARQWCAGPDRIAFRVVRADGTVERGSAIQGQIRATFNAHGVTEQRGGWLIRRGPLPDPNEHAVCPNGRVYFLRATEGGPIKIGYTARSAPERLAEFDPVYPYELRVLLTLPGGLDLEREMHGRFARFRLRGEWFRDDPELLSFIEAKREEAA